MSNETKSPVPHQVCNQQSSADVNRAVNLASKRVRLVKQELLRTCDRWGQQFPIRLLAEALSYCEASELALSQEVCSGWKLTRPLEDRLWRAAYLRSWEAGSEALPDIAVQGAETPWLVRYRQRQLAEDNWLAGRYRAEQYQKPALVSAALALPGDRVAAVFRNPGARSIGVLDLNTGALLHTTAYPGLQHYWFAANLATGGDLLFAASANGAIRSLSLPDLKQLCEFKWQEQPNGVAVTGMCSDGKLLAAVGRAPQPQLAVWDAGSGEERWRAAVPVTYGRQALEADWWDARGRLFDDCVSECAYR